MDIRLYMNKKLQLEDESCQPGPNINADSNGNEKKNKNEKLPFSRPTTNLEVSDLPKNGEPIKQIVLLEYPKENSRSFRAAWYSQFKWLQYSVANDSAFCYACMQFNRYGTKETTYTQKGFRNWKNALDYGRGFPKHEKSEAHIKAMAMWKENQVRVSSSTSISTLVNEKVLEKHRYYIKSIVEVIQFLAVNELAFRGDYVIDEHYEKGLFSKLFEYTIMKDKTLAECAAIIPRNATYLSPEIQNEIIEIMAEVVRESVANDIKNADVPWFTLLEDGTRDKNNRENIAIAARYVKDGKPQESLLDIITTANLDAQTFTECTLKILSDNGIDKSKLLSQCYDGANVMSGKKGGVAALIEKNLERNVPYVHCFNHRLHLVLVKTISEIVIVKHFFEQCVMLHSFFKHGKVAALYEGKTIVRLLEQRWSGHFKITNVIFSNYKEIVRVLDAIPEDKRFDGEDVAMSKGIKSIMISVEFCFCLVSCKKLLGFLQPADAALQSPTSSLEDGIKVIKSVILQITSMRSEDEYKSLMAEAEQLISGSKKVKEYNSEQGIEKRQIKRRKLTDFILTHKLPTNVQSNQEENTSSSNPTSLIGEFYEIIDMILSELNERFGEKERLLLTMSCVEEFDATKLQYLGELGK